MITRLALRSLLLRPWRSALLLTGFGLGVGVMIVLLSVGEAMLTQARSERLVGGGDVTVLPEGIDVEVMKTGGLGGLFFSVAHSRFVYRQLLAAPRLTPWIAAVAPQMESKLLYARMADGREWPLLASGELPSRNRLVGAGPTILAGSWEDDAGDTTWRDPSPYELRHEIDHFHLPPPEVRGDSTWAEWHYFNVLSPDEKRWAFITYTVAGAVPDGRWGGQLLITLHERGRAARRFTALVPARDIDFSTTQADLRLGAATVRVLPDGRYRVVGRARETAGNDVTVDLTLDPAPGAYFPGAALAEGEVVSGYAVAALRARGSGRICAPGWCESFDGAPAYHDHNWGVWRGVTWEWGAAQAGGIGILYGRVQPDTSAASQPMFVYLVDTLGFVGLFRPREIRYDDSRVVRVPGRTLRVPGRAWMADARDGDTLRVELAIDDAVASRAFGGDKWFVQMRGNARLDARIGGRVLSTSAPGFFETYR